MAGEGGLSTRARSDDVTLITCHLLRSGEHCQCLSCYPFVIAQKLGVALRDVRDQQDR